MPSQWRESMYVEVYIYTRCFLYRGGVFRSGSDLVAGTSSSVDVRRLRHSSVRPRSGSSTQAAAPRPRRLVSGRPRRPGLRRAAGLPRGHPRPPLHPGRLGRLS